MASLVTFEEAVEYCHLVIDSESPPSAMETDMRILMEVATALVVDYVKQPDHPWRATSDYTADRRFAVIKGAILKVISGLWMHRGDDDEEYDPLCEVKGMLSGYRKPTIA